MFKKIDKAKPQFPNYEFKGKMLRLTLSNANEEKVISFDYPIRQVVSFEDRLLVRLEPDLGEIFNENVYCYSSEGAFLWQVEQTETIDADCPYTNVAESAGDLFFYNWSGEKVQIDPLDGKVIKKEFAK